MTLPWGSDNGTCLGPVEQTLEDTWPGSLHMSLPHILPEEGKRGREGGERGWREGRKGKKKKRKRNGNGNFIHSPTLALFPGHS